MGERNEIERGIELLKLCQQLQSAKDGVERPDFAKDVHRAILNMSSLYKLFPLLDELVSIGRSLEAKGLIKVDYGEDYSEKAVEHFKSLVNVETAS